MKLPATIFVAIATLVSTPLASQVQAASFSTGISITNLSSAHQEVTQNDLVQNIRSRRHRGSKSYRGFRNKRNSRGLVFSGPRNRVFTGSNTFNNSRLQDSKNFDSFAYRRFKGGVGGGLTGGFNH